MEYRPLGATGVQTSAIGFGCWEIAGGYGRIEQAEFANAVRRAVDAGIICFDTAEAYGMGISERALADALGDRRRDVLLVSKFGVGYPEAPNRRDSSRRRIMASIETSLRNLATDHVDLYLVHWPDVNTPFEETVQALDDVVRQGKARHVGVSNFRLEQVQACMRLRRIDVVQYAWHMFDRRMQTEIFPYCAAERIGVMAYGSLAYGMLSGAFHANMRFDENDWRSRGGNLGNLNLFRTLLGPEHFPRKLQAVEALKAFAASRGKTLPQLALRWTLSNPVISVALVGCRRSGEVEDNLGALGWTLTRDDLAAIDLIFARHGAVTMPPGWLEDG
jgi:aryl-alcohol dehydrogenase-like predicted oxidoreductase